jgi:RNA polymerase sigma-70 factor (ECF subfamily)
VQLDHVTTARNNEKVILADGAPPSTESLYRQYAHSLLYFIERRVGRRAVAEELVHEVFLRYARISRPGVYAHRAYLFQIAHCVIADHHRWPDALDRTIDAEESEKRIAELESGAPEELDQEIDAARLQAAIDSLPRLERAVFELIRQGVPAADIARQCNVNRQAVLYRRRRAVELIAESLGLHPVKEG